MKLVRVIILMWFDWLDFSGISDYLNNTDVRKGLSLCKQNMSIEKHHSLVQHE